MKAGTIWEGNMAKRVGILTSGGDCQALNATMRGLAKALFKADPETKIFGFLEGYKGLMYGNYREMTPAFFSGILTRGGTIIGTSRQPFKMMRVPDENGNDKVALMKQTYKDLQLDALVVLGGNGSQKSANMLSEEGLNVIGLPKTIDKDLYGTDMTFGFESAVNIATETIDCIHTTAASHGRVFIVEVMGHKVGWLTLHAGIAGGADVILLPEIPYDIDKVIEQIADRREKTHKFSIIAVAEGAISVKDAKLGKKEYKKKLSERKYPSVAYEIAAQLEERNVGEVRVTVPGHMQRGGSPCPQDRFLSTRIGARGAELIMKEKFGVMVVTDGDKIKSEKLSVVAGKIQAVPVDSPIIEEARLVGIGFGD